MPIQALWYGVIIGEMIYLGGEWVDNWRAKRRATMRSDMDQSRRSKERRDRRLRRHRERSGHATDSSPTYPIYEEYDSDTEATRSRPRLYIQDGSRSSHHGRDRRIESNRRRDEYPINEHQHYYSSSSPVPNMDRSLVVSNGVRPEHSPWTSKSQTTNNMNYNRPIDLDDPYFGFTQNSTVHRQMAEERYHGRPHHDRHN